MELRLGVCRPFAGNGGGAAGSTMMAVCKMLLLLWWVLIDDGSYTGGDVPDGSVVRSVPKPCWAFSNSSLIRSVSRLIIPKHL